MCWSCGGPVLLRRRRGRYLFISVVVFDCVASPAAGSHGPVQEAGVESQGRALCGRVRFTHTGVDINGNLAQYTSVHSQIVEVAQTIFTRTGDTHTHTHRPLHKQR